MIYKRTIRTKQKLINAVIALSFEKGYDNVTVRDSCKRAGVSNGAFYHHYATKDALSREAYLSLDFLVTDELLEKLEGMEPLDALQYILELQVRYVESLGCVMCDYYKILLSGENISLFAPERPYYQAVLAQIKRCLKKQRFKPSYDAEFLTDWILRFVRGCIVDWCIRGTSTPLLHGYRENFSLLISGLAAQSPFQGEC